MPTPVTKERVAEALDALGVKVQLDDDGDMVGRWQNVLIMFVVQDMFFQLVGQPPALDANVTPGSAAEFCASVNEELLWPCMSATVLDMDGTQATLVRSSYAIPTEAGLTDGQLAQTLATGIKATNAAFGRYSQLLVKGEDA